MRKFEYRDPLEVLMRRGEDCTHCKHIEQWSIGTELITVCGKKRKMGKRCQDWRHKDAQ